MPMKVHLKIVYDPVTYQVYLQGFIKLSTSTTYDWSNYFFSTSPNNELIELGSSLSQDFQLTKDVGVVNTEIFQNDPPKNTPEI